MLKRIDENKLSVIENQRIGEIAEKVVLNQDLASLQPNEKFEYVKQLCLDLKLNILTKPIQLIKFQGKEIIYFTKDATEQIRNKNSISITSLESKVINGTYVVRATALTPDGRVDSSTGAVTIDNLKGDMLANAMMKAETKAKRRVTLSICGLGILDESELETMHGAVRVDAYMQKPEVLQDLSLDKLSLEHDQSDKVSEFKAQMSTCKSLNDLKDAYSKAYLYFNKLDGKYLKELTEFKDHIKLQIESELNQDVNM